MTNSPTHKHTRSKRKEANGKRANKLAKVKRGEENERQMANNVMCGIRVCDGYLVCLDLCVDISGNDARNRQVLKRSNFDLTWRKPPWQWRQKSFLLSLEHALVFP